jgi:hypothetical protein
MPGWGAYLSLGFLFLGGFAALKPGVLPWVYVAAVLVFEMWLLRRISAVGSAPVPPGEAPYHFTAEEAALVGRFRFYFTYPEIARHAASALAALGLSAIVLAPWLTFKQALLPAVLIGINLFAVGRMTKVVAPLIGLRIRASKGDREALRLLEVHDPAWAKIRAANEAEG